MIILLRYWKIWAPALGILLVGGVIFAQAKRIDYLKEARDVAIYEHDRAVEEQQRLRADLKKLNTILADRNKTEENLRKAVRDAEERIKALSSNRPDVRTWLDSALPDGVWNAVRHSEGAAPGSPDPANSGSRMDAKDKR